MAPPELFPLRVRAAAVSVCVTFNWLFTMAVALAFPSLLDIVGAGWDFLFFAVMTFLAWVFVKRLLPETRGRSLEQIEREPTGEPAPAR